MGGIPFAERNAVLSSFHYHYARLIEILFAIEHIQEYLLDPSSRRSSPLHGFPEQPGRRRCCEAPRAR